MAYPRVLAAGQRSQIWIGGPRLIERQMAIQETSTCSPKVDQKGARKARPTA